MDPIEIIIRITLEVFKVLLSKFITWLFNKWPRVK